MKFQSHVQVANEDKGHQLRSSRVCCGLIKDMRVCGRVRARFSNLRVHCILIEFGCSDTGPCVCLIRRLTLLLFDSLRLKYTTLPVGVS